MLDGNDWSDEDLDPNAADRRVVAADLARHLREVISYGIGSQHSFADVIAHIEHLLDRFDDTEWGSDLQVATATYGAEPPHRISPQDLVGLFRWALPFVEVEAAIGATDMPTRPL